MNDQPTDPATTSEREHRRAAKRCHRDRVRALESVERLRFTCEACGRTYALPETAGAVRSTAARNEPTSARVRLGGRDLCKRCASKRFPHRRLLGGGVLGDSYIPLLHHDHAIRKNNA